jgi:hypothetical protein
MINSAGRILTASDVECLTDGAAFAWAGATLGTDASAEIWRGATFIGSVSGTTVVPHAYQPNLYVMAKYVRQRSSAGAAQEDDMPGQFDRRMHRYVNDNAARQSHDLLRHE